MELLSLAEANGLEVAQSTVTPGDEVTMSRVSPGKGRAGTPNCYEPMDWDPSVTAGVSAPSAHGLPSNPPVSNGA